MKKKRIFIVNAHPGGNIGAEAMLCVVTEVILDIRRSGFELELFFERISASDSYQQFTERFGVEPNFIDFSPKKFWQPYNVQIRSGDVMLDVGGIAYHGKANKANFRNFIRHSQFLKKKARMIFFTQDYGPAEGFVCKYLAKIILSKADVIFSRSQKSKILLSEDVPGSNVLGPFPDCTFALSRAEENYDLDDYLVVSPSAIVWNQHGSPYLKFLIKFIEIASKTNRVLILAHNFTANGASKDPEICRMLYDHFKGDSNIYLRTERSRPELMKKILGGSKGVLTSRFHALVGAMSSGVPSYTIGWNHKYNEFLRLYSAEDWALNDRIMTLSESDTSMLIGDMLGKMLDESNGKEIREANVELVGKAEASLTMLKALIKDRL